MIRGQISYSRFKEYVADHLITSVNVSDNGREAYFMTSAGTKGYTLLAPDPDLLKYLTENGVDLSVIH